MLPTIALVGRPNVGKSTLFNRLTKSRDALVADYPGLTRDRHYGRARADEQPYLVVDTGGFEPKATSGILHAMAQQTRQAIAESDVVVFMVDGRLGLAPQDTAIADLLRRSGRPVVLAVNKAEGLPQERAVAEFHELGLGDPVAISAAHGENVRALVDHALSLVARADTADEPPRPPEDRERPDTIKVAIVGRPNVGKSTLVNAILGEERVIAFDEPGTTRDAIYLDFERGGRRYKLIDTAGIRRRGKVFESVEKFSVIKTMQAIEDAHVVVLLVDASDAITEQDAHLAGHILEAGRALVVAVNKWDAADGDRREQAKRDLDRKLAFLDFAPRHFICARDGKGVAAVLKSVGEVFAAAMVKLPTPRLTRTLQMAVARQQPPRAGLVRPKLRYAHQGGVNPPLIVVHGTALQHVPAAYRRYLEHFFSDAFQLRGTPLRIQFKAGANPYVGAPARRR
ncbi:MAG: ribosome biogenesis GTPase Der [Betaproteobacteria bacterium]|nr:ribosome biogenesis GTPase Der [Betaproteobacteria bacterium]MCC7218405.1 ribosome biogenesis GTPase Der [Burkholderiales bacterium]